MPALSGWLLPRGTTIELNRDEYVKPGPLERAQTDQILFGLQDPATGARANDLAEIREMERFSDCRPVRDPDRGGAAMTDTDVETRPRSPIELRSTGEFAVRLRPSGRSTWSAIPYDQDAAVVVHGRAVVESCAPGAFDGVERRANRVKVNRDHDYQRTVGRAVGLHPSRTDGLVAELRIAKTPLGDETLALADDRVARGVGRVRRHARRRTLARRSQPAPAGAAVPRPHRAGPRGRLRRPGARRPGGRGS